MVGYLTTEAVATANDSFAGVLARLPASAEPVLTMPQQLVAGTMIVEETIVSQQAARRQTSRPHLSYTATVSYAGLQQDGAHVVTQTGSQRTGSQQTGVQHTGSQQTGVQHGSHRCLRCQRPASASPAVANAATQVATPINRTKNLPFIVGNPRGCPGVQQHLRGAAIPGAGKSRGGGDFAAITHRTGGEAWAARPLDSSPESAKRWDFPGPWSTN